MAAPPTANDITAQLKTLFTPIIGTAGTKKSLILDYLPLAFLVADHEDTTALQSPLDKRTLTGGATVPRINCLLISASPGFSQAPPQRDSTRLITDPRGRNVVTRRLALVYLYEFGEASEATFNTNVELIRMTINDNPKLGFAATTAGLAGQGAYIAGHDGWQVPNAFPQPFPSAIVHAADGTLTVRVMEPLG